MSKKPRDFEDDGRTIADMSSVERQPLIIPKFSRLKNNKKSETESVGEKPWEDNSFNKKERKSFIFGALGATLLVSGIFALAFALIIILFMFIGK